MLSLPTLLVVYDDQPSVDALAHFTAGEFDLHRAADVAEAANVLQSEWVQILLYCHSVQQRHGREFLGKVRSRWPEVVCMVVAEAADDHDFFAALSELRIYQWVSKPWRADDLLLKLRNASQLFQLQRQNDLLHIELKLRAGKGSDELQDRRRLLQARFDWDQGIVRAPESSMNQICELIRQVAPYDVSVMLTGESGTGKELCARALHANSLRHDAPFIAENCGALPDELLESELFGHKRGAFTGAVEDRTGLFEQAHGGTIFLDEICEVSAAFQVKLLRVLQEGEIRPLGSNDRRSVDVRVIAATNRDLDEEVSAGRFREDLYYRLATFIVKLPPLREHPVDIAPLAHSILADAAVRLGKKVKGFTDEAIACLQAYHWPGNVRELQNEIKRMLIMAPDDYLGADLIGARILLATPEQSQPDLQLVAGVEGSLKKRVATLESRILKETLIRHHWNKSRAAEELGLSRVGLRGKLERYDLV